MKQLFALALLLASSSALADTTANIHYKDWEVNGSTSLSHSTSGGSAAFSVFGAGQYFFMDEFSAGLEGFYSTYSSSTAYSVGLIGTKYFSVQDKVAPYVSLAPVRWTKYNFGYDYFSSGARVGVKFFLNDFIAVGPALDYTHRWAKDGRRSSGDFSLLGLFSMHL